jgi:pantetheine-phosphate adenylyltransferase
MAFYKDNRLTVENNLGGNHRAGVQFSMGNLSSSAYIPPMRTVIYPGSFDPLTNGHLDLIQRAATLFDQVVVAVAKSESKNPLFPLSERLELVQQAIKGHSNVIAVIRGLRALSDFEFEFQLALMNRKLNEQVETIFMMPKETYTFLSSRIIKEIATLGGDVSAFVPAQVCAALSAKIRKAAGQK